MATVELRDNHMIVFKNGDKVIMAKVSDYMEDIVKIIEFDRECALLTFEAKYCTEDNTVEEYLDLMAELSDMGISDEADEYFNGISTEGICILRK